MTEISVVPGTKPAVPQVPPQRLTLTLLERIQETHNIVSFVFAVATESGKVFRHHPGQAVSLNVPFAGSDVIRTFTIASAPNNENRITLTIKAGLNARATAWMHQEWQEGKQVEARGPFGHFSLVHHSPQEPILLVGAGSGLTPMLSMLRWLYQRQEKSVDLVFLQQAATPEDLLCVEELAAMDARLPNLTQINAVSQLPPGQSWSGVRGMLSRAMMKVLVPDLAQRTVFCCGPAGFNELVRRIHRAEGGDPDRFLTESFGSQEQKVEQIETTVKTEHSGDAYRVQLDDFQFHCEPGERLVDAAAAAGIRIPTACREGHCGTCKLKLLSGEVSMTHQGGLSRKEEQQGFILGCSSCASSDLQLTRKY